MANMYQKIVELKPNKDPHSTAVSVLTNPEEIKTFVKDCINYYKVHKENLKPGQDAETFVKENISYILAYHNQRTINLWVNAVSGISRPIFEREVLFT